MGYDFSSPLTSNLCLIYLKLLVHVLKQYGKCSCDFEVNQTKIRGGCQSGSKVVPHNSKSDLPLVVLYFFTRPKMSLTPSFCPLPCFVVKLGCRLSTCTTSKLQFWIHRAICCFKFASIIFWKIRETQKRGCNWDLTIKLPVGYLFWSHKLAMSETMHGFELAQKSKNRLLALMEPHLGENCHPKDNVEKFFAHK